MTEAKPDGPQSASVGILFVHGIGAQKRGETLLEGAEALERLLKSGGPNAHLFGPISVADRPAAPSDGTPAHRWLDLQDSQGNTTAWLIAEAHWAEEFEPPRGWSLLLWLWQIVPVLFIARAGESVAAAWHAWGDRLQHFWRVVVAGLWVVLAFPAALLLVLLLTLLVFLGAIPGFKSTAGRLSAKLTAFVGDSYIYVADEQVRSQMVQPVVDSLDFLSDHSAGGRIVVVAHSQGAAITARALRARTESENPPPYSGRWRRDVDGLITFGAGVSQLEWFGEPSASRLNLGLLAASWLGACAALAYLVFTVLRLVLAPENPGNLALGIAIFGWPLLVGWMAYSMRQAMMAGRGVGAGEEQSLAKEWVDVWASADPVPGGPSTQRRFKGVNSVRIWTHAILLHDHITYFKNSTEFVARILHLVAKVAPDGPVISMGHSLDRTIPISADLRRRRGRWMETLRAAIIASVAIVLIVGWSRLWKPVVDVRLVVPAGWLGGAPSWVGSVLDWISMVAPSAIAVATVILGAFVVYAIAVLGAVRWAAVEQPQGRYEGLDNGSYRGAAAGVAFVATYSLLVAACAIWWIVQTSFAIDGAAGFLILGLAWIGLWAVSTWFLSHTSWGRAIWRPLTYAPVKYERRRASVVPIAFVGLVAAPAIVAMAAWWWFPPWAPELGGGWVLPWFLFLAAAGYAVVQCVIAVWGATESRWAKRFIVLYLLAVVILLCFAAFAPLR